MAITVTGTERMEWQLRRTLAEIFQHDPGGSVIVIKKRGLGGSMWIQVGSRPVPRSRPGPENDIAAALAYRNRPSGRQNSKTYLYYAAVPIDPTKTVQAVALLDGGGIQPDTGTIRGTHVFAIAVGE